MMRSWKPLATVTILSGAALALEIVHTRLFAFALWHHLAFFVVSIALLGFGAAGASVSLWRIHTSLAENKPSPTSAGASPVALAALALLFALALPLGPWFLTANAVDVFGPLDRAAFLSIVGLEALFALPFFFAGCVIAHSLARSPNKGRLCAANLLGSAAGCFLPLVTLEALGAEGTLGLIAAAGALAALLVSPPRPLSIAAIVILAASLSVVATDELPGVELRCAKTKFLPTYEEHGNNSQLSRWTPLARIDVFDDPLVGAGPDAPGAILFQDGDAPGQIPHRDYAPPEELIHTLPYRLLEEPDVLVIGVGGGLDLHVAVDQGARSVTGVEVNPTLATLLREDFHDLTGGLVDRPDVTLRVAEGRHFVRHTEQDFDLIQISGVDTYTSTPTGPYVLSESYLYTMEAFHDYLDHLRPGGLLSISRFAFPKPRETLRILVMACSVLRERGIADPWNHVAVLRNWRYRVGITRLGAVLVKPTPFDRTQATALRDYAKKNSYSPDWIPGIEPREINAFVTYLQRLREGRERSFLEGYPYLVTPATDERPFFFDQHKPESLLEWWRDRHEPSPARTGLSNFFAWQGHSTRFQERPIGLLFLAATTAELALLSLVFVFLPLLLRRGPRSAPSATLVFVCFGLAYIFVLVPTIQRFTLVLSHPTWSFAVVTASFLTGSGLGSLVSERVSPKRLPIACLVAAAAVLASTLLLRGAFLEQLVTGSLLTRAWRTGALLLLPAFALGLPFPLALRTLSPGRPTAIAWAFGTNAAASVLGSAFAVAIAMTSGFTAVSLVAATLYVLTVPFARRLARS